jgi:hypothetical protein
MHIRRVFSRIPCETAVDANGAVKGTIMAQPSSTDRARSSLVVPFRRDILRGLAGLGIELGSSWLPEPVEARKKRKNKKRKKTKNRIPPDPQAPTGPHVPTGPLCTSSGEPCSNPGTNCQEGFCLQAPFTISATWQSTNNHDTWLFVPPQDGATGPRPQIDYDCNQTKSPCAAQYPFACVSRDASGPGDEVTTIFELLPGRYEYWIASQPAAAGELTVTLTDRNGRLVRAWINPAVTSALNGSWHVFDLDGVAGRVTSVDAPPARFPLPVTNVCPV